MLMSAVETGFLSVAQCYHARTAAPGATGGPRAHRAPEMAGVAFLRGTPQALYLYPIKHWGAGAVSGPPWRAH